MEHVFGGFLSGPNVMGKGLAYGCLNLLSGIRHLGRLEKSRNGLASAPPPQKTQYSLRRQKLCQIKCHDPCFY